MHLPRADWTRWFIALLAVVAVAGWSFAGEASARRDGESMALARKLALQGAELREVDSLDALWLGAAAVRLHTDGQTRDALADTLANERRVELTEVSRSDMVAMASDGSFVLALPHGEKVRRWDLGHRPGKAVTLDFGGSSVDVMAMSADGGTVLTAEDYIGMTRWDLGDRSRPVKGAYLLLEETVEEIVLTPDGKTALVAYALDEPDAVVVEVWDLRRKAHPARRSTLKVSGSHLYGLAISADGKTAVAVRSGGAGGLVWDLTDLAHPVAVAELNAKGRWEESVALSPDGRRAVLGTSGSGADVWDLSDRSKPVLVATMDDDFHDVFAVAMARDGDLVLTADFHGRAILWDLSEPSRPVRLAALKTGGRGVQAIVLSEDGRTALVGSTMRGPRIWDLSGVGEDPLMSVCNRGNFEIRRELWDRYTDGRGSAYADGDGDFRPCDEVLTR